MDKSSILCDFWLQEEKLMRYISATEAKQSFGATLDSAQREPVVIRKQNRDVAVLLSAAEYEKLRGARIEAFDQICDRIAEKAAARGLSEEDFDALMRDAG
jgi:prevent-host-death family protein